MAKIIRNYSIEFSKVTGETSIRDLYVRYTIADEDLSKSNIISLDPSTITQDNLIPLLGEIENIISKKENLN